MSLTVVTADGRIVRTAGRARKSSAGYDLTRVFVGSEGTLGIITEVTVRLYPQPEAVSAAVCNFPTLDDAVQSVIEIIQMGVPVARVEFMDAASVRAVNLHSKLTLRETPLLVFEFHGSPAGVQEQAETVQAITAEHGGMDFEWAERPGRPQPPLDRASQCLLRRPAAASRLSRQHHRRLRANLAPGRLRARNRR